MIHGRLQPWRLLPAMLGAALILAVAGCGRDTGPPEGLSGGTGGADGARSSTTAVEEGDAETPLPPTSGENGRVPANRTYALDTGDRLDISVFGEPDLSGEVSISEQGTISLPLIGQVEVAGKTVSELEDTLVQRFEDGYLTYPQVSVEVLNYRPFYILGEVEDPGSYSYVTGMTVLNAVALAGGFTPRANEEVLYLERPGEESGRTRPVEPDTRVLPGDIIHVRQRRLF